VIATFDQIFRFIYRTNQEQQRSWSRRLRWGSWIVRALYLKARKRLGLNKTEPPKKLAEV
jgi:hypothetical protein